MSRVGKKGFNGKPPLSMRWSGHLSPPAWNRPPPAAGINVQIYFQFPLREGMPDQKFPKYRHCLDGRGGSDPCLDFFEGFVHMHCGPSKVIIYHQQVIFPHKSVPYSPEKIIQPHLFNIFTLKHDLHLFVEKVSRVASTHFYRPNRS